MRTDGLSWEVVCWHCGHAWEEETPPVRCPSCRSPVVVIVPTFIPPGVAP